MPERSLVRNVFSVENTHFPFLLLLRFITQTFITSPLRIPLHDDLSNDEWNNRREDTIVGLTVEPNEDDNDRAAGDRLRADTVDAKLGAV